MDGLWVRYDIVALGLFEYEVGSGWRKEWVEMERMGCDTQKLQAKLGWVEYGVLRRGEYHYEFC